MAVVTYKPDSALARYVAQHRHRFDDPRGYDTPRNKRVDGKFALNPLQNELYAIVEQRGIWDVVRVKNTTGSTWTAPVLLKLATSKLSAQTTTTATNSPSAGAGVTFLTSATFEVGQVVQIVSGGYTDYALVTAISAGVSVTVDYIYYDHTTPVITALPAYEASLADADDTSGAHWATTANISDGAYGWAFGQVESPAMDTSGYSAEAILYLSGTAGGFTATAPTGVDQLVQEVGVVKSSHASTGRILWYPGRRIVTKAGGNFLQSGAVPTDWKNSVRVATTAAGTLASDFENGDTVDGVVLATGDRILLKNQSAGAENGIYTVNASGAPTRATDADTSAEVTSGMAVHVEEGTSNADTNWLLTTNNPITLGSTALVFTQLSGSGGAPASAQYLVLSTNGTLTDERVATAGSMIGITDAGAGSTATFALDINGGSALADLAEADQVAVYDASATANRKTPLSTLLGLRNLVINGDWSALNGPITSGLSPSDNRGFGAKGWRFLGESNGSTKMNFTAPSTNVNAKYSLKATVVTNNEKFAVAYAIPSDQVIPLRGKTLTLSAWLKVASIDDVRMAVIESTGTADSIADPISAWGTAGTNPTLTGWSYISESGTPANKSPNGTLTRYTVSATVGASANNLMVLIWCDDKTTTVTTSVLEVADVELVKGSVYLDAYERLPGRLVSVMKSSSVMAIFKPQDNEPPAANYATPDTRNGHAVLDFDDSTDETAIFSGIASEFFAHNRYPSAVSVLVIWSATSATSGNCYWKAALERCTADDLDVDSDSFASDDGEVAAANGTTGKLIYTVLDGSPIQSDSILPLEKFRLKLYRDANNAGDTMPGDAEVHAVILLDSYDVEKNIAA